MADFRAAVVQFPHQAQNPPAPAQVQQAQNPPAPAQVQQAQNPPAPVRVQQAQNPCTSASTNSTSAESTSACSGQNPPAPAQDQAPENLALSTEGKLEVKCMYQFFSHFTLVHHVLVFEIVGYLQMLSVVGHEVKLGRACYLLMWNVIWPRSETRLEFVICECEMLLATDVSSFWLGFWLGTNQAFAPFMALSIVWRKGLLLSAKQRLGITDA